MSFSTLTWRCFPVLSDPEAASVSKFCLFSFATLEVASCHDTPNVSLVEQEHPDAWRWVIFSPDGFIIDGGSEPTQADAKKAAEQALRSVGGIRHRGFQWVTCGTRVKSPL